VLVFAMSLLLATANRHKTGEFAALFKPMGIPVRDLSSLPDLGPIEETGATFEENSAIKAIAAARAGGSPALADDSGIEVEALGMAPGVHSSRFAGPDADDAANRARLLRDLAVAGATTPGLRRARFRCVLTLARPDGSLAGCWSGSVAGYLLEEERGDGGFGYDPLFVPDGQHLTMAEIPAEEKNQLSHRARATAALLADVRASAGLRSLLAGS